MADLARTLAIGLLAAFGFGASIGHASETPPARPGSKPTPQTLRTEIRSGFSTSFETLLRQWEKRYGSRAVEPLLRIAHDRALPEQDRYIALMGAAKLGGREVSRLLIPFLKDPIWMLRTGALRALSSLGDRAQAKEVLSLLGDRALVVRLEAVEAVEKLRPEGAAAALLAAAEAPENYRGERADWVPQRALAALRSFPDSSLLPRVQKLLDTRRDPAVRKEAHALLLSWRKTPSS